MREIPRLVEQILGLWSLEFVSYQAVLTSVNIHVATNIHRNIT